MTIVGHGGGDIIRQALANVINVFKKKRSVCTSSCDGLVLKMHYQWTFWMFLGGFSMVWYSWYHRDVITCVSHFNAENQVRLDYINICLSYPYVQEGGTERYLLFYRWIHWALITLAVVYYIPRKISKCADNARIKKLFEDLAGNVSRYEQNEEDILVTKLIRYFSVHINTHNGLYFKFVYCNFVSLIIDILCFQALDFLFQGRFIHYGWMAYPYTRDPEKFEDYMSLTFPPFAKCSIAPDHKLINKRTEEFGCHLVVMELYEKVFLFIWVWLIILTTLTSLYLIFLGFMWLPYFRVILLRVAKPKIAQDTVTRTIINVLSKCKIGDVYLLYRLKQHLSHARYYQLLTLLSNPDFMFTEQDAADHVVQTKNKDNLRNRQHNMAGNKGKMGNPADLFIPNSSILVE